MKSAVHFGLAVLFGLVVGGMANVRLLAESSGLGDLLGEAIRREAERQFEDQFDDLGVPIYDEEGRLTGWTHIGEEGLITYDRDGNVVSQMDDEGSLHNKPEVFREVIIPQADGGSLIVDQNGVRIVKDQKRLIELGATGVCMPFPEVSPLANQRFCISPRLLTFSNDNGLGVDWLTDFSNAPGLREVGGVKKGGTFILTRDDEFTIRADYAFPLRGFDLGSTYQPEGRNEAREGDGRGIRPLCNMEWSRLTAEIELRGAYEFREEAPDLGVSYRQIPTIREGCILNGKGGEICLGIRGLFEADVLGNDIAPFPQISGIPLIGSLFKNCTPTKNKTELCIFVTPRILEMAD